MRALIQRVTEGRVLIHKETVGEIGPGLVVLLGVGDADSEAQAAMLADKVAHLRIFSDGEGKFNRSLLDTKGAALVVSQFTLYADTRKGRRPSFAHAAAPELAEALVEHFCQALRDQGVYVATGRFGAMMQVHLVNDGPVTIWLDTADWQRPRRVP